MINVVHCKKQKNSIYCGRGSALGNPFPMKNESERNLVCDKYEAYFREQIYVVKNSQMLAQCMHILDRAMKSDVSLGCYCAPRRCHCDTIKTHIEFWIEQENAKFKGV